MSLKIPGGLVPPIDYLVDDKHEIVLPSHKLRTGMIVLIQDKTFRTYREPKDTVALVIAHWRQVTEVTCVDENSFTIIKARYANGAEIQQKICERYEPWFWVVKRASIQDPSPISS